jgi:pyruvate, water dikinase
MIVSKEQIGIQPTVLGLDGHNDLHEVIGPTMPLTVFLDEELAKRVDHAGGKGTNLAELRTMPELKVPNGFVITASLSEQVLEQNPQIVKKISKLDEYSSLWLKASLGGNKEEAEALKKKIFQSGKRIEKEMKGISLSAEAEDIIAESYKKLSNGRVAVRSSGVSEDGNEFSFAGQNNTDLHMEGKDEVIESTVRCIASQFGERAIEYRNEARLKLAKRELEKNPQGIEEALAVSQKFSHTESRLAVVVQEMADGEASGIGISVDSSTGANLIEFEVVYGLGESNVSGDVTPDYYEVDPRTEVILKQTRGEKAVRTIYSKGGTKLVKVSMQDRKKYAVSNEVALKAARTIKVVQEHYFNKFGTLNVDVEFVIKNGEIILTQARPETIASNENPRIIKMRELAIPEDVAKNAEVILKAGKMGSPGAASGKIIRANGPKEARWAFDAKENKDDDLIWAPRTTSPDSVPWMKRSKGILTEIGGTKAHAAIVSRELRVPCIVGAGKAVNSLKSGEYVTMDARKAIVYKGKLPLVEVGEDIDVGELIKNRLKTTRLGMNLANPDEAKRMHALAELGKDFKISLLRAEFLLGEIGVHINALVDFDNGRIEPDTYLYKKIARKLAENGSTSGKDYFITKYAQGISTIAAMFPESDIVLRTTDFKTNEYKGLLGGNRYELKEENPMMGKRGLPRFLRPENQEGFKWELEAIKKSRDNGYKNIEVMFPMVRDPLELNGGPEQMRARYGEGVRSAYDIMNEVGLVRGADGLKTLIMVENPANVIRLDDFIDAGIDGISIGSNDLTQLILAVDRDNEELAKIEQYSEMNPAVITALRDVLRTCKRRGIEAGICGNGPSNYPELVRILLEEGITSIGVTADRYLPTHRLIRAEEEGKKLLEKEIEEKVIFTASDRT